MRCLLIVAAVLTSIDFVKAQFTPVCTPGLCNHNSTCVERPMQPGGFVCLCADGYHGRTCNNKLPEVDCLSDRIILSVDKGLIAEEVDFVDSRIVYLGLDRFDQSDCLSRDESNQLVVELRIPFSKCGTISKTEGSNLVYKNRLYLDTTRYPEAQSQHRMILLDWSCVYSSKYFVSIPFGIQPAVNKPERRVAYGQFTVDLSVFTRSDYLPASRLRTPATISSGQRLYTQVELMTSQQSDLVVTYKSCRATNSPLESLNETNFSHELINRGCPSDRDPTVSLISSGSSTKARFSFRMFMWSGEKMPVYLHCVVTICNVTRFESACQPPCGSSLLSGARLRRSAVDDANREPDLLLALGPFLIEDDEIINEMNYTESNTTLPPEVSKAANTAVSKPEYYVLTTIGVFGVLCIILISVLAYRRYWRNDGYNMKGRNDMTSLDGDVMCSPSPSVRTISHGRIEEVDNASFSF